MFLLLLASALAADPDAAEPDATGSDSGTDATGSDSPDAPEADATASIAAPADEPTAKEPMFGQPRNHSGFRTGGATGSFTGDGVIDATAKAGGTIGAFTVVKMFWLWSIEPEIIVSRKSAGHVDFADGLVGPTDGPIAGTWVELPMLVRTKVPTPKWMPPKPYGVVGPFLAVKAGGSADLSPVDVGWVAGGGTDVYWKDVVFSMDTRYSEGKVSLVAGEPVRSKTLLVTTAVGF